MDIFDDSESESESESDFETEKCFILLPGTEIPKSLKFNHQSFGNSVSFKVGCKFPKLAVCVAFRSAEANIVFVHVYINGCKRIFSYQIRRDRCDELWLFSKSLGHLNKLNLLEQNQVEVKITCKISGNHTNFIKWLGVNVECICCPQKSNITYLPLPSDRNGYGSSLVLNDTELPPFQPLFPTSYGFEPGLKGFLCDLNASLSAPNNSELLALLPGPNVDHDVSNTINDLRLLKGIHNDGCDTDERESEPPLFPDLTNGFDFGFVQPNLELGSGVSSGFHLGSSSMANASVNDDSDFYMGSSSMAHDCLNDDSDFNMSPPPKKARTS